VEHEELLVGVSFHLLAVAMVGKAYADNQTLGSVVECPRGRNQSRNGFPISQKAIQISLSFGCRAEDSTTGGVTLCSNCS
jgi:hypothetical protein